jgi:hypothetical protein
MKLGGPQNRSGYRGEEKILDPTGTRTPTSPVVQAAASPYTDRNVRICKTIILPVVLYGCETWYLTLRQENMFDNIIFWRIFGPKCQEVTAGWRKLDKGELHNVQ